MAQQTCFSSMAGVRSLFSSEQLLVSTEVEYNSIGARTIFECQWQLWLGMMEGVA